MDVKLIKSLIWFSVAVLVAVIIQIPMLWQGEYHYMLNNTLIIALTILFLRNAFDFKQISLHKNKWVRYFIFVLNIFLFIYILNRLEFMLGLIDNMDMNKLITSDNMSLSASVELFQYIHKEYLFFSVASFVAIAIYNIKLLTSFWQRAQIKRERQLS